jgi:type VI secretion system protein VasJ
VYSAPVEAPPAPVGEALPPELDAAQIADPDTAVLTMEKCSLLLQRAGDALRAADPGSAVGYRVHRTGLWLQLGQDPPNEGGVTYIPGPQEYQRGQLAEAAASGDPQTLLNTAEALSAESPLWLDPHRHAVQAMEMLGEQFDGARQAVLVQLASLLNRAPTLPALLFNDSTPIADPDTIAWLETVKGAIGSGGGGGGGGGSRASNPTDKAIKEAQEKLGGDMPDLPAAFAILHKAAKAAPAPADKFRARLAIAKISIQVGQINIAKAQLEGLERTATYHHLAEWQPDLCAELYAALYSVLRTQNAAFGMEAPPEFRAKENAAFEKLCELDSSAALKLMMEAPPM